MVKIGLIGCGRIATSHMEAIKEQGTRCKLIAVCDTNHSRAIETAQTYDCNHYTSLKEMLDNEKLDLLSICTPSGLHPKHGIIAAEKKINILTEKPIGVRLNEVDELIRVCDDNGVNLFVVKQNRLNSKMRLLKKAVEKNRFGKIYMVQTNVFWHRPKEYYDVAKWRGTWELDGGAFLNQASHYIDMLYWLIGEVESVMAITSTMARKIEAEDTGSAVIKFRNGTIGTINVTMLTYPKNFEGSITIIGEKGTVKIGGTAINLVEKWEFADYDDDDKLIMNPTYESMNARSFGHIGYYSNVLDALKKNTKPSTDGNSGRKSLEIVQAIYLSSKNGSKVSLPLSY